MRRCWSAWACSAALVGVAGCGASRHGSACRRGGLAGERAARSCSSSASTSRPPPSAGRRRRRGEGASRHVRSLRAARRLLGSRRLPPDGELRRGPGSSRAARSLRPAGTWSELPPCLRGRRNAPTRRPSSGQRTRSPSPSRRSSGRCWRFATAEPRLSRVTCAACGSENPAGKRFCGDCGAPLGGGLPVVRRREPARTSGSAATAARRSARGRARSLPSRARRRSPSGGWSPFCSPTSSGSRRCPSRATPKRYASSSRATSTRRAA